MSTTYDIEISKNPSFQTVSGLTNKTWDPETVPIVSGRGATEDQLQVVDERIIELSNNVPECTDDPFTHLKQRVNAMEEALADCSDDAFVQLRERVDRIQNEFQDCSDDPFMIVTARLDEMETRQITCCEFNQDAAIAVLENRIADLEALTQNCCSDQYEQQIAQIVANTCS